jgi:hypothetical protein
MFDWVGFSDSKRHLFFFFLQNLKIHDAHKRLLQSRGKKWSERKNHMEKLNEQRTERKTERKKERKKK